MSYSFPMRPWIYAFYGLFGAAVFMRRGRPTHLKGVAARGEGEVVDDLDLPPNRFFIPGRKLACVVRHGNVAYDDDAAMDLRGCALRLSERDRPFTALMDLPMNSGPVTFSTALDFLRYTLAAGPKPWTDGPSDVRCLEHFLRQSQRLREQYIATLRRAPESYANLHYYSKMTLRFHANDGVERYARLRVVPADGAPETGLPDAQDRAAPWDQERRPGVVVPYDYLKEEYRERVKGDGVRLLLQMQLMEPFGGMTQRDYDPGEAWDLPWRDVATLHVKEALSPDACERLRFNVSHLPRTFDLPSADTLTDTRSIGAVRARVYEFTQDRRWLLYFLHDFCKMNNAFLRTYAQGSQAEDDHRRDPDVVDILRQQLWFDRRS